MSTEECVILPLYPPYWETLVVHPSKETQFCLFYNAFPPFVCSFLLTACLLSARCASRGKLASEHFPEAVQIVDLYHAQEHVWQVARAVYGPQTEAATAWAKNACDLLVYGKIEELVAAIAVLPPIAPNPGESRSVPEKAVDYFTSNAERMRYPTFRAQGMHVGSGEASAACKTVVATRLKRCSMRWTPDGLDALLPLRTAVLNQTYHDFWKEQPGLVP